jgi:hypothetical protein
MFRHLLWKQQKIDFKKKLTSSLPIASTLRNQLAEITPDAMALPQLILGSHPLPRINDIDSSLIVLPDPLKLTAYFVMPSLLSQFLTKVEVWANLDGEYKLYYTSIDLIFRRIFAVKANYRLVGYFNADNYANQEIKTSPIYDSPSDAGYIGAGVVSGLAVGGASIFATVNSVTNSDAFFYTGLSKQSYDSPMIESSILLGETIVTKNSVFFFSALSQSEALSQMAEASIFIASTTTTNIQYTWSSTGTIFN